MSHFETCVQTDSVLSSNCTFYCVKNSDNPSHCFFSEYKHQNIVPNEYRWDINSTDIIFDTDSSDFVAKTPLQKCIDKNLDGVIYIECEVGRSLEGETPFTTHCNKYPKNITRDSDRTHPDPFYDRDVTRYFERGFQKIGIQATTSKLTPIQPTPMNKKLIPTTTATKKPILPTTVEKTEKKPVHSRVHGTSRQQLNNLDSSPRHIQQDKN